MQQGLRKLYVSCPSPFMMKYTVVLEKDEDGIYVATVPALPGCISDGKTVEEALTNIREAIQGFIDDMKSDGEPIPGDVEIIGNVEVNA
jgi:predicted RNase H-like HicB family nuclease